MCYPWRKGSIQVRFISQEEKFRKYSHLQSQSKDLNECLRFYGNHIENISAALNTTRETSYVKLTSGSVGNEPADNITMYVVPKKYLYKIF